MKTLMDLLFPRVMFGVVEDEGGGAPVDRGDNLEPETPPAAKPEVTDEDEKLALGKTEEPEPEKVEEKDELTVPKSRFDEVRNRSKEQVEALQAKNRELEEQIAKSKVSEDIQAVEDKISELTKSHAKLLSDGELDKAAEVFTEIRQLDRQIALQQAQSITERARVEAREDIKMDSLVAKFEADHPFLNPDNPDVYSPDAVEEVLFLRQSFEQQGLSRTQALSKAVNYVVKTMAPPAQDVEQRGLREKTGAREKEAIAKKLAAAQAQPPNTDDTGFASDKIGGGLDSSAVMHMTQEEFAKLPERELAKLRGDSVA